MYYIKSKMSTYAHKAVFCLWVYMGILCHNMKRGYYNMARLKKHSVCWTICYAVKIRDDEDDFYTATWFAYGRSAEEAKQNFMRDFIINHEEEADDVIIVRVFEGFSC